MMKKMSRLVSVLLVVAMLCAMVPAVLAKNVGAIKEGDELWVNDTFTVAQPTGCTGTKVVTYENRGTTKPSSYTIRANNDGTYTATSSMTNSSGITITVKGSERDCNHSKSYNVRVYNNASYITAKVGDVTVGTNGITIVSGDEANINYTLQTSRTSSTSSATVKQAVALLDEEAFSDVGSLTHTDGSATVKVKANGNLKGTNYRWVRVAAVDGLADTDKNKAISDINVTIIEKPVLKLKEGSTVVASSETKDGDLETHLLGTKSITLTTDLTTTTGNTNKVQWSSDNPQIVTVKPNVAGTSATIQGYSTGKGTATITATYTLKTGITVAAKYKVIVGKADSLIVNESATDTDASVTSKSIAAAETMTLYSHVKPETFKDNVTWKIDDTSVLQFDGMGKDATSITAGNATMKAVSSGDAIVTVSVGDLTKRVSVSVTQEAQKAVITAVYPENGQYIVRYSENPQKITDSLNETHKTMRAYATIGKNENQSVDVPIIWGYPTIDKANKTATISAYLQSYDEKTNTTFTFGGDITSEVKNIKVILTDDAAVTKNEVKFTGKDTAVANDKVSMSCTATREPSDAKLTYQWYCNGMKISGATSATYTYTVPADNEDANETYEFYCIATATRNGKDNTLKSNVLTLKVSREYSISVDADVSNATYTVGQSPKMSATVRYKGSTISASVSWKLLDKNGKELGSNSNIATISSNGTITTKATGEADGQKITVQAQYTKDGYTYTGSKTITLKPASAGTVTMAAGTGSNIKASTIQTKVKGALGSNSAAAVYVKFGSPSGCTLTKSSGSSTAVGTANCYFSTTSGQKLSDVYVKLNNNSTSGSVEYTAYDSNDNALVTGKISFTSESGNGGVTAVGISLKDADVLELIGEEFANVSEEVDYIKFDTIDTKKARLLDGYKGIVKIDSAKDVTDSTKYFLSGSSDNVEDLYLLPRTDFYGTIKIDYTAYSSRNKSLGEGTLTFEVVKKTSSSNFTDVTNANVGSWAADAIDFMAENELVGGVGNKKFNPTGTMTRGDFVLILYRMAGEPSVAGVNNPFNDVKTGDYFYNAVMWAYKNSVVGGMGAGKFAPKNNISREQIASILYRYSGATKATGSLNAFTDASKVSGYAVDPMKWAVGAGIIGGSNNKLDPQGNATRAQVVVMLHRFLNK